MKTKVDIKIKFYGKRENKNRLYSNKRNLKDQV